MLPEPREQSPPSPRCPHGLRRVPGTSTAGRGPRPPLAAPPPPRTACSAPPGRAGPPRPPPRALHVLGAPAPGPALAPAEAASCNVAEFIYNKDLENDGGSASHPPGEGGRGRGREAPQVSSVRMLRSLIPPAHPTDVSLPHGPHSTLACPSRFQCLTRETHPAWRWWHTVSVTKLPPSLLLSGWGPCPCGDTWLFPAPSHRDAQSLCRDTAPSLSQHGDTAPPQGHPELRESPAGSWQQPWQKGTEGQVPNSQRDPLGWSIFPRSQPGPCSAQLGLHPKSSEQ